jgi:hypothetical protein
LRNSTNVPLQFASEWADRQPNIMAIHRLIGMFMSAM